MRNLKNYVNIMSDNDIIGQYTTGELAMMTLSLNDKENILDSYYKTKEIFDTMFNKMVLSKDAQKRLSSFIKLLTTNHENITSIEFYLDENIMLGVYDVEWRRLLWYAR
jgi:hypothetical protein